MPDKTWKAFERRIARRLGTERIPAASVMGGEQKDKPDAETETVSIQAKKGYKFPAYLREWLDGIRKVSNGKLGVVVWGDKGARDDDALVVMRFSDFVVLLQRLEGGEVPVTYGRSDTDSAPVPTRAGIPA